MKFPRNARIFRGQLDAAPFVIVLFLLVMFLFLSGLIYTPGVRIELPLSDGLAGTDKTPVAVALDANGRLFYQNQLIEENDLKGRLRKEAKSSDGPLALLVYADRAVSYEAIMRLTLLARDAGISEAWLATLPRAFSWPAESPVP